MSEVALSMFATVGIILFFASVLQGVVGFAFALFSVPALVWAGLDLSDAVAVTAMSIFVQAAVASYQLRADVKWREVLPATAIRYATIPIGIVLLIYLDAMDKTQMKQILGVIIFLILLVQIFWKVEPQENLHPVWMVLAFSVSGIITGMVGMGGPPAVLWVMAHDWTNRQTRAFLLVIFLLATPLQIVLLYIATEGAAGSALLMGLAFSPMVILGAILGVKSGNLIAKPRLRQMTTGILFITAAISFLTPYLRWASLER